MDGFIMRKGGASGGGSADLFAQLLAGTLSGFVEHDGVEALAPYALGNAGSVTGISFPNCKTISNKAFSNA